MLGAIVPQCVGALYESSTTSCSRFQTFYRDASQLATKDQTAFYRRRWPPYIPNSCPCICCYWRSRESSSVILAKRMVRRGYPDFTAHGQDPHVRTHGAISLIYSPLIRFRFRFRFRTATYHFYIYYIDNNHASIKEDHYPPSPYPTLLRCLSSDNECPSCPALVH